MQSISNNQLLSKFQWARTQLPDKAAEICWNKWLMVWYVRKGRGARQNIPTKAVILDRDILSLRMVARGWKSSNKIFSKNPWRMTWNVWKFPRRVSHSCTFRRLQTGDEWVKNYKEYPKHAEASRPWRVSRDADKCECVHRGWAVSMWGSQVEHSNAQ